MIKINTEYPIAYDSPDHIQPHGTKQDNHTSLGLIEELKQYLNKQSFSIMDIGCSGGQFIVDCAKDGHTAVGIEGSDYSIIHQRANWPLYHNKNLFTADASKPFEVTLLDEPLKFDVISAFEVIEHIAPNDLNQFFKNIYSHLKRDGIFIGSISDNKVEIINGHVLHQSVFPQLDWRFKILTDEWAFKDTDFEVDYYPFNNAVRKDGDSFLVLIKNKTK
jgi:cyclopropane fatty-acyl-phospholipid synthase-like methyltransferase